MNWFVYIILASNNSLYTGITTNVERRWKEHSGEKKGGARFFYGKRPVALMYVEEGHDRSTAGKREVAIKKMTRVQKEALLKEKKNKASNYTEALPVGTKL
ncbi:GIY-YIG nuclease family protein [Endozoicomonas numazuensis]|uniref:GIY-YIG nuclease family protein n=1 Tax=Endozoicomonas numazuensis TaxID=1137799 RepID=UPI000550C11E|nr:GIY-YIG nuclease family protein [Endozoicomonas numazuensis]